jgi:hypothetical protein
VSSFRAAPLLLLLALVTIAPGSAGGGQGVAARVVTNQLLVELTVTPSQTSTGKTVKARATLTNAGAQPLDDVSATLHFDPSGLVIEGPPTLVVGRLDAQRSTTVTWNVCGDETGQYVLLAQGSGTRPDGLQLITESLATVLAITPGRAACRR